MPLSNPDNLEGVVTTGSIQVRFYFRNPLGQHLNIVATPNFFEQRCQGKEFFMSRRFFMTHLFPRNDDWFNAAGLTRPHRNTSMWVCEIASLPGGKLYRLYSYRTLIAFGVNAPSWPGSPFPPYSFLVCTESLSRTTTHHVNHLLRYLEEKGISTVRISDSDNLLSLSLNLTAVDPQANKRGKGFLPITE